MPSGTLEVSLVGGHGLKSGDFFSKTDAYCILTCGSQTQKSNVARNQGSKPTWNQNFVFFLDEDDDQLLLKVMDEDFSTADDELGNVKVPLAEVFETGKTATKPYNVVQKDGHFKGEIRLSLSFTTKESDSSSHGGYHRHEAAPQTDGPYGSSNQGGWSQGS